MNNERLKQPLVLAIFGITGDLSQRYILPALYQLAKARELPEQLQIVGLSRREVSKDEAYNSLQEFVSGEDFDMGTQDYLLQHTEMRQMDMENASDYTELLTRLKEIEADFAPGASRLYYLSVPSRSSLSIIKNLGETGHAKTIEGTADKPRLLVEKPFGYDSESSKELIAAVNEHFGEEEVYRIDHYVAKETVQNILTFRFQNPLFEAVWNNEYVDRISVIANEKIGIEGRVNFYEQTGALRDLVQSHLLQLLAITTMDKPDKLESSVIHARKLELFEAITPIEVDQVAQCALRGQYEGYREEVENSESLVETYAKLELTIDSDRWRGVPIMLETGKALSERRTEIIVSFKQTEAKIDGRNKLVFRIKPTEGITLQLQAKQPGITNQMQQVDMDFDYSRSFNHRPAEAYERVIVDAIRGDQTLFATADEVLASWKIIENVLQEWSKNDADLRSYAKGSEGPKTS